MDNRLLVGSGMGVAAGARNLGADNLENPNYLPKFGIKTYAS